MLEPEELRESLELGELPVELIPNSNISPGQNIPVVLNPVTREVRMFRWGLVPGWAKDAKIGYRMFNARSETLSEKPSFRTLLRRRRCLIPADGFYEWKELDGEKYPFLFTLINQKPFTFAGLWDTWQKAEGEVLYSCTLITTEPNELLAHYHNRMPVILGEDQRWQWLEDTSTEELKALLRPFPADKMSEPVRVEHL
jgi:putative SOS response-associated peptidase YedK